MDQAVETIKGFEGYRSKAYWDVDHWRVGYGSDTTTDEDGTVHSVTKGTVTTRAAADRDLTRRVPIYQQQIIAQVGQDAWNGLNNEAKAAVTSVAYNYGSLTGLNSLKRAIATGDSEKISTAILNRGVDNGGINQDRRTQEAALVAGHPIPPASIPTRSLVGTDLGAPSSWGDYTRDLAIPLPAPGALVPPMQVPGENINGGIDYPSEPQAPAAVQILSNAKPGTPETGFNTVLAPADEVKFQAWKKAVAPNDSGADYDFRGAYAAGVMPMNSSDPAQNGHWPDTFKKPGEPTFSVESQYAKYAPAMAGHWDGDTFVPPVVSLEDRDARYAAAHPAAVAPVPAPGRPAALDAKAAPAAQTVKVGKHTYTVGDTFDQGGFHYVVTPNGIEKNRVSTGEPNLLDNIIKGVVKAKTAELGKAISAKATTEIANATTAAQDLAKGATKAVQPVADVFRIMGRVIAPALAPMFGRPAPADGYTTEDGGTRNGRTVVVIGGEHVPTAAPPPVASSETVNPLRLYSIPNTWSAAALPKTLTDALAGSPLADVGASVDTHFAKSTDPVSAQAEQQRTRDLEHDASRAPRPVAPPTLSIVKPTTVNVTPGGKTTPVQQAGTQQLPADEVPKVGDRGGYSKVGAGPGTFGDVSKILPSTSAAVAPAKVVAPATVIGNAVRQKVTDMVPNPAYVAWQRQNNTTKATNASGSPDDRQAANDAAAARNAPPPPPKTIPVVRTAPAVPAAPTAAAPKTTQAGGYVIQAGDTLSAIAKRSGTTVAELQRVNNIADANKIRAGATLTVPVGGGSDSSKQNNSGAAPASNSGGVTYVDKSTGKVLQPYTINSFNNDTLRFETRTGYH